MRCLPILEAEERLKSGEVGDAELYDVVLVATGSKDAASAALEERVRWRVKHNQRVDLE